MENLENKGNKKVKDNPIVIRDEIVNQEIDNINEVSKKIKQKQLNLSLLGLFFSLFFIGGIICIYTLIKSLINLKKEKSTLSKWTVVISICAIIISGLMIFAGFYYNFFKDFKMPTESSVTLAYLV